jgi:hypothetical protein
MGAESGAGRGCAADHLRDVAGLELGIAEIDTFGREAQEEIASNLQPGRAEGESYVGRSSDNSRSKYSMVGTSPSLSGTAGCHPSFFVANDMSGWR